MKITLNAIVSLDAIDTVLNKQKEKVAKIDEFCKTNKINVLVYKDSELEYEYTEPKPRPQSKCQVETAKPKTTNIETR